LRYLPFLLALWALLPAQNEARAEIVPGVKRIRLEEGYPRPISVSPSDYVPLAEVVAAFGLRVDVDSTTHRHRVQGRAIDAALCPGMRRMLLNGRVHILPRPVVTMHGETRIPRQVAELFRRASPLAPGATPSVGVVRVEPKVQTPRTIIIDAGHGGRDPGAIGAGGLQEKEVVIDVAQRLSKLLELKGHRVILTRSGDRFLTLNERTEICRKYQPALFLSMHVNAARNRSATGFETYYRETSLTMDTGKAQGPRPADLAKRMQGQSSKIPAASRPFVHGLYLQEFQSESRRLAQSVQSALVRNFRGVPNRGIKKHDWYVVRWSQAPSALVELDFVSNASAERKMRTSAHRRQLAEAVFQGIENYLY